MPSLDISFQTVMGVMVVECASPYILQFKFYFLVEYIEKGKISISKCL